MQKVILKAVAGPHAGLTFWLANQEVILGRTSVSDLVLDKDKLLSSKHFRVSAIDGYATVTDLNSTNGTRVNGERIQCSKIRDGDRITAGKSVFVVSHEEVAAADGFDPNESYYGVNDDAPIVESSVAGEPQSIPAVRAICPSGLVRYSSKLPPEIAWESFVPALLGETGIFVTIDYSRLPEVHQPQVKLEGCSPFFQNMPAICDRLPLVLEPKEVDGWPELLAKGWGKNALMLLQSDLPKADFVSGLQKLLVPEEQELGHKIVGLCWPGVLRAMLFADPGGLGRDVLKIANAILLEGEKQSEWQLFGKESFLAELTKKDNIAVIRSSGHHAAKKSEAVEM